MFEGIETIAPLIKYNLENFDFVSKGENMPCAFELVAFLGVSSLLLFLESPPRWPDALFIFSLCSQISTKKEKS